MIRRRLTWWLWSSHRVSPPIFLVGSSPAAPAQALSLSASPSPSWSPASSSCSYTRKTREQGCAAPAAHLLKAGLPTVLAQVSSMTVDMVLFSPHASPFEYVTVIVSSGTQSDGKAVRSHVS